MMTEHECKWNVLENLNCDCGEELWASKAEAILNEQVALKRENEQLKEIKEAADSLAENVNKSSLYSRVKGTYYWLRDALEAYDALLADTQESE